MNNAHDMELSRVKNQTLILLLISFITAAVYWKIITLNLVENEIKNGVGWPALVSPFLVFPLYAFREMIKSYARSIAFFMAVVFGLFLGAISGFFEKNLNGIVIQALLASFSMALAVVYFYKNKIIKVNDKFVHFTVSIISAISFISIIDFIMSFIDLNWRSYYDTSSNTGIFLNIVIIVIAYLIFSIDLDIIHKKIEEGKNDKNDSWIFSIELLTDIAWMYFAFLFLIGRVRGKYK